MNNREVLIVEGISYSYDSNCVLDNVSFEVEKGNICGLLGANGSGKTTLLKCINGLLKPREGKIIVEGREVGGMSREEIATLMAVVPQQTIVVFAFTVLQMVVMGRAVALGRMGRPHLEDYDDAELMLKELGIDHLAQRCFNELSGGERQMVLLARALFQNPKILLLDEPTSHLDFKNQFTIMQLVQEMTRFKDLVTIVTLHDPNLAGRYCDQMVMINKGMVVHKGLSENVFIAEALESIYDIKVIIETTSGGGKVVIPDNL